MKRLGDRKLLLPWSEQEKSKMSSPPSKRAMLHLCYLQSSTVIQPLDVLASPQCTAGDVKRPAVLLSSLTQILVQVRVRECRGGAHLRGEDKNLSVTHRYKHIYSTTKTADKLKNLLCYSHYSIVVLLYLSNIRSKSR